MSDGMLSLPPLALYIHIPWCVRKCPYCDFNSHEQRNSLPEKEYIEALIKDYSLEVDLAQGRELHSIFIGGGTPSLFSADSYAFLLEKLAEAIPFTENIEITMEANPGTAEQNRFTAYRKAGINRLSLGIQSFNPDFLKALGRIHNDSEALEAIDMARYAGFDNLNLDLMFGLPGQSISQGLEDLKTAISRKPEHLSWYQLTLEPNTLFYRYPPILPEEDHIVDLQEKGQALLASHGYQQYEISAYAQENHQSQHNMNYWTFGDYLGIGAGAHGKITLPDSGKIIRTRRSRQPDNYMKSIDPRVENTEVILAERPLEYMMNTMRLQQGGDLSSFSSRTGLPSDKIALNLKTLADKNLIETDGESFRTTQHGRQHLNDILLEFMP